MAENNTSIFLSHSTADKEIASLLKGKLSDFKIDVFLAHDDIEGGIIWEEKLMTEIKNREIFMILLSKNYHMATYTDQELGIGIAYTKKIIPLSIDGTKPYGFINKIQSERCSVEINEKDMEKLLKLITGNSNSGQMIIDQIIYKLITSTSYAQSIDYGRKLKYFSKFTNLQINNIAIAYFDNNQIYDSGGATSIIMDILKQHKKQIEFKLRKDLGL